MQNKNVKTNISMCFQNTVEHFGISLQVIIIPPPPIPSLDESFR